MKKDKDVKEDIIRVSQGTINSLEHENMMQGKKIEKFQRIVENMSTELKQLKKDSQEADKSDPKKKNKTNEKELNEANKKVKETMEKLGNEMNMRAKAETEIVRANKMIDYLQEIIEKSKKPEVNSGSHESKNIKINCRDQENPGGCSYGNKV